MMLIEEKTLADHDINVRSIRQELSLLEEQLKKHGKNDLPPTPTIEPEPHWIPCSERLPEEDGLYLVTTSKGQVQVHVFNHNGNSEEYWMRCNKAWMPLPEPYKEGEK